MKTVGYEVRFYEIADYGVFTHEKFMEFMVDYIQTKKLFNLRNLLSCYTVEKNVVHHGFRLAREIFGGNNVKTWTIDTTYKWCID